MLATAVATPRPPSADDDLSTIVYGKYFEEKKNQKKIKNLKPKKSLHAQNDCHEWKMGFEFQVQNEMGFEFQVQLLHCT